MKADVVAATCHGVRVPFSPFLNETRIERISKGRYEGQEIAGALAVITDKDRLLELGAGLGIVGAVAAKAAKAKKVLSFEANPALIPHIETLHALNRLGRRMEVRNQVLVSKPDAPKQMTFHLAKSFLGSSLIDQPNRDTTPIEIETAQISDVIAEFKPTVLMMDIEGGELELLSHMDLGTFRAVIVEFHPKAYGIAGMRRCKSILRAAGFRKQEDVSTRTVWTCVKAQTTG